MARRLASRISHLRPRGEKLDKVAEEPEEEVSNPLLKGADSDSIVLGASLASGDSTVAVSCARKKRRKKKAPWPSRACGMARRIPLSLLYNVTMLLPPARP